MKDHSITRTRQKWKSYGIEGQGPVEDTLVMDLGDEHLLNIIKHLERRGRISTLLAIYYTMHAEIAWRLRDHWTPYSE
jgi:hypothetical protein